MKKIGVLYGRENTFPGALIHRINEKAVSGITADSLVTGAVTIDQVYDYQVIVDRVSQDVPFYRALLKNAVLAGVSVINNPFWWTADDKFFNYALAERLGVAVPRTALVPHKQHPPDITAQSLRNLQYPIAWDELFAQVGFPAYLKPYSGDDWMHVYKVHSPDEFFAAYDQTGDRCMVLQAAIDFDDYFRCYVVGRKKVHVMRYDPRQPEERRYVQDAPPIAPELYDRLVADCLTLNKALGYDMNTVEFALSEGVPYAIDFLNPAPDANLASVGQENFDWLVEAVADLAIEKALSHPEPPKEFHWSQYL